MGQKMRLLWIFALASAATAVEEVRRDPKMFSLFSVVTFPNSQCTTTMDTAMQGVCQTTTECSDNGGTASGNCASGFGVCCFYKEETCGSTVSNNCTYLQNSGYPSTFSTASTSCAYTISGTADICQIRLDFDNAVFAQPSSVGTCTDSFTATSPTSYSPPTLCGTFTGTHMYIETGRTAGTAATINTDTGTDTSGRSWKIKVSLIECSNPSRAPTDCVQYFTGTGGIMTSYNTPDGLIRNQEFDYCIRQEEGFCSFEVSESSTATSPDPFVLGGAIAIAADQGTAGCTTAWVQIRAADSGTTDLYCGTILSGTDADTVPGTIYSDTSPFRVSHFVEDVDQPDASGFSLRYAQRPCV